MASSDTGKSRTFQLKVWGDNACFTRPEMKVERVSYDVMTPSAARGILEAIFWKPAIRWVITQVDVLKPIRWESVRRNEVGAVLSASKVKTAMNRGAGNLALYVEDERQQRASLLLRDVAYTIHAHFVRTERAGPDDTWGKLMAMFERRSAKGQCFHRPYLGCREFAAHFALVPESGPLPDPIPEDRDLGYVLHDQTYGDAGIEPHFFRAEMAQGRITVPSLGSAEVRR
jgi:CRISPR-associated protein Cas5d